MTNENKIVATGAGIMLFGIIVGGLMKGKFNNRKQKLWDKMASAILGENKRLELENTNLKKQLEEEA
jgi:hypothetical protein